MALATRCPHCQTTFRVAHDQLKLRAGLVRCGACKEIFNGVEHLLRPDEMQQVLGSSKPKAASPRTQTADASPQEKEAAPPPPAPVSTDQLLPAPSIDAPPAKIGGEEAKPPVNENHPASDPLPSEQKSSPDLDKRSLSHEAASDSSSTIDPLQRMTLMDFTAFDAPESQSKSIDDEESLSYADRTSDVSAIGNENTDTGDELSQAIDDLHNKPWRHQKVRKGRDALGRSAKRGKGEPTFMARARREKRYGKAMRWTMGLGSAALFIALLLQGVYTFRNVIAATMPEYRPILAELCAQAGCQINLPAQVDKVSIESSELQSLPSSPSKFTLVALLRNQASTHQAWPYLELTLNDMNEKPVARKVFHPKDYLASAESVNTGFPEQSEHQVRIAFELLQLKAAGYHLYLFYP